MSLLLMKESITVLLLTFFLLSLRKNHQLLTSLFNVREREREEGRERGREGGREGGKEGDRSRWRDDGIVIRKYV